ncbi:MAG: hypothetical protein JWN56_3028 [Sphingobacteriales bacterium]|nr:hypothetical protein [Sphingobacteriales bacterium]
MKINFRVPCLFLLSIILFGCGKEDTEFKSFLNDKEIIYPGRMSKIVASPGNQRIGLAWNPSSDPSIKKYVIYWNNKKDSLVVNATNHNTSDTVKVIVPNLNEYTYSFTVYSFDDKGNKSIPLEVNNVKVFGSAYQSNLLNRPYNATNPYLLDETTGSVALNFSTPDTINISTVIKYTNKLGVVEEKQLGPQSNSMTLTNYKAGTIIQYKSSYIPVKGSIDTFNVANYSEFPRIYSYVECDKSLFQEVRLSNDVNTYEGQTSISKLWDRSVGPQGYPNIFHSDGAYIAHVLTFDMGKIYTNLGKMEEVGRNCCNNPDKFEVWGIADITNAATTLRADNSGWKNEAIAKGWTLLKDVIRTDDGVNALKVDLISNPPPVRYIRIRVLHTTTGSSYSNMSELTFWNKQ